jgi:hypothetical protein
VSGSAGAADGECDGSDGKKARGGQQNFAIRHSKISPELRLSARHVNLRDAKLYFHGEAALSVAWSSAARPWTYDVRPGVSANVAANYKIKSAARTSWTFWDLYRLGAEEFSVFGNVAFWGDVRKRLTFQRATDMIGS